MIFKKKILITLFLVSFLLIGAVNAVSDTNDSVVSSNPSEDLITHTEDNSVGEKTNLDINTEDSLKKSDASENIKSSILQDDDSLNDVKYTPVTKDNDKLKNTESNNNQVLSDDNSGEYIDVSDAFTYLNEFRTEDGVWYWNKDNTTKTVLNTNPDNQLQTLKWDAELEEAAKIRAQEISKVFNHTRPDGRSCYTAYPTTNFTAWGENIAYGYATCQEVTEAWEETDELYKGQGHRRNMLSSIFNCVGIAGYKVNGIIYWVQAFGRKNNIETEEPDTPTPILSPEETFNALNTLIQNSPENSIIKLERNYTYNDSDSIFKTGILINKSLTIDGQGHTINAKSKARIFNITDVQVILKNINIINGYFDDEYDDGGAINAYNCDLTIINSTFKNNKLSNEYGMGGAIYTEATILKIEDSVFTENFAPESGAIHVMWNEYIERYGLIITNSNFTNNIATNGGGALQVCGNLTITNSIFTNNTSIYDFGGAIFSRADTNIINSLFNNNTAGHTGGAIFSFGDLNITKSTFTNNSAKSVGGAVAVYSYNLTVSDSTFINNKVTDMDEVNDRGGVIYVDDGSTNTITNCNFTNNSAINGGVIYSAGTNITIINSRFTNNTADKGKCAYMYRTGTLRIINTNIEDSDIYCDGDIKVIYNETPINKPNPDTNNNADGKPGTPNPDNSDTNNPSTVSPPKKITPQKTKILASKKTFKAKIKTKKYTITLKSGKNGVAKVTVYLSLKGKKYKKTIKTTTNTKGKAIFKIKKLSRKGKYTATITFKGNKTYKKSNRKVQIIIK